MMKFSRKTILLLALALVFSFVIQSMTVFAAGTQKPDLTVSKDGKKFTLTKGDQTYSFRFEWDPAKKTYTGYSQKKVDKMVRRAAPHKGLYVGSEHEGSGPEMAGIVVLGGVTLNKKIWYGMSLESFHKKIRSAWGDGYYAYWSTKKGRPVRIGKGKPTDRYVKKRCKDTGLYWAGDRGRLRINVSIKWNKAKNRAEVGWTEMWVISQK